jgi:uncharacterized protein (DUF1015 family)
MHPQNLITVEKGLAYPEDSAQNNVYTRAAAKVDEWVRDHIVEQDSDPAFYAYTQEFTVPGTSEKRTRRGFIGAGRLEEYSAGVIFRHEHTLTGPKADRLELLRNTRTHTGQLFMLYSDPQQRVEKILNEVESSSAPVTELTDEYGVVHRLWSVSDEKKVAAIQQAMSDQKLVIADGHHRYETALNYRNQRRAAASSPDPNAGYERSMMTFVNTRGQDLVILAGHRVVANVHDFSFAAVRRYLEPWFSCEVFPFTDENEKSATTEKFLARLANTIEQRSIGAYPAATAGSSKAFYLFQLRPGADLAQLLPNVSPLQRDLDVVLLHDGILEPALGITLQSATRETNLTYEREAKAAIAAVDSGRAQIAFLLNPVEVEKVVEIATANEVMPQKSTDFYPKLLSGITMYRIEP